MSRVGIEEGLPIFSSDGFQNIQETNEFLKETTTFEFGGQQFFATYWKPQSGQIIGLVFLCHGYAEYISPSYDELAENLAKGGLLVFGHDHVGHGRSSGMRVQVNSLSEYIQPVLAHVRKVKNDHSKPLLILGHSMGGLITINVLLSAQELFNGAVFMGPLVMMNPDLATPFKRFLASIFCRVLPNFAIGGVVTEDITRDQAVVERVKADDLIWHGGFRALHSSVLLKATDDLADGEALKKIHVPLLIFQGGQDKLVFPSGAQFLHDTVGSADKKIKIFQEAFHNLYVELEDVKLNVIKETCDWMLQHCEQ